MGKYINDVNGIPVGISYREKINMMLKNGAQEIREPYDWVEGLICVVDNGHFAAAAYAFDENEMKVFKNDMSLRPKTWMLWADAYKHAK